MRAAGQVLLIVTACAAGAQGQVRPNFSGTWVVVPSRSIWYDNGSPIDNTVFGERFTVEQSDVSSALLSIETSGSVTRDGRVEQVATRRRLRFNEDGTLRVEAPWGRGGAMIGSVYAKQQ